MGSERDESIKKIKGMLEGIDFCMLTTIDNGGNAGETRAYGNPFSAGARMKVSDCA